MIPSLTLLRKPCSVLAAVVLIPVCSLRLTAAAANGPTVTVKEPVAVTVTNPVDVNVTNAVSATVTNQVDVNVKNPVDVQGYVEVLNDALRTPFNKRVSSSIETNNINTLVSLPPIPAGKRLVIEGIGVTATVGANTRATAFLTTVGVGDASNSLQVPLPLESQGAFGLTPREHYMGLHKIRIVVDPRFHSSAQFNVFRSAIGDVASVTCTIVGYLEDIPATP